MAFNPAQPAPVVERTDDNRNIPVQFLVGAVFGGLGGYMDSLYIEPFGLFFGGTLAAMQILDYNGLVKFAWNPTVGAQDMGGFLGDNLPVMGGFASGYFIGYNILDWTSSSSDGFGDEEAAASEESSE